MIKGKTLTSTPAASYFEGSGFKALKNNIGFPKQRDFVGEQKVVCVNYTQKSLEDRDSCPNSPVFGCHEGDPRIFLEKHYHEHLGKRALVFRKTFTVVQKKTQKKKKKKCD